MIKQKIKVKDNREKIIDVKKFCPGVKIALDAKRLKIERSAFLRETIVRMLHQAQKKLPNGWNFVIRDAWRPTFIQVETYFQFIEMFKKHHSEWSPKRVLVEVEKYVADWKGDGASGHMTGGAVDLRVIDKRGRRIPLRSKKLSYQENALPLSDRLPNYLKENRKKFFAAMEQAGFSGCHNEFWHWSYGDHRWAKINKKSEAFYGVIDDKNFYEKSLCPCGSNKKFSICHGLDRTKT